MSAIVSFTPPTIQGWRRHGSYCYFIGTETKTFDEAKDDCKRSDSYLADVSTGYGCLFLFQMTLSLLQAYEYNGIEKLPFNETKKCLYGFDTV